MPENTLTGWEDPADERDWTAGPRVEAHPQVAELVAALTAHGIASEVAPSNGGDGWRLHILGAGGITEIGGPDLLPEHGEPIEGWLALHFDADDELGDFPDEVYESEAPDTAPVVEALVAYHRGTGNAQPPAPAGS